MRPYPGPPWTDSHQIWAVDVFHHAPPIHGIQNAELQKKKKFFCDAIASVLYNVCKRHVSIDTVLNKLNAPFFSVILTRQKLELL